MALERRKTVGAAWETVDAVSPSGGSLIVTDGSTTVTSVTEILFNGAVTGDNGGGIVEVDIAPGLADVLNEDNNGGGNGISDPGAIDMNSNAISNLADPSDPQDAATKNYVDTSAPAKPLADVLNAGNDANTFSIANLSDPSDPQDAATKAYVDGLVTAPQSSANISVAQAGATLVLDAAATFVRWVQLGQVVFAHFEVVFDTGTTGTAPYLVITFADLPALSASYVDAGSLGSYFGLVAGTNDQGFIRQGGAGAQVVLDPSGNLQDNDHISGSIIYEAA